MLKINTYLNFQGNTLQAFEFYKTVFDSEFSVISRYRDYPDLAANLSESDKDKLMHIALPITDHYMLMGTDILDSQDFKLIQGNNFSISISTSSKEEADQIFAKLAHNGTIELAMEQMFWGDYFGMLTDQFGIKWMIAFDNGNS